MENVIKYAPRVAFFLAGAAVAALTASRRQPGGAAGMAGADELKRAVADLEARFAARDAEAENRFTRIETRIAELPSTAQVVSAMEQLLSKTMASIDDRLVAQAQSIETLKTTVSQTDSLLERVLESLDSLQSYTDPAELAHDPLLNRPVV